MNNDTKLHYLEAKLKSGAFVELSVFRVLPNFLMLHGEDISAQWNLNKIGIEISAYETMIKVRFHHLVEDAVDYQNWYFSVDYYSSILDFFKSMGMFCNSKDQVPNVSLAD